CRPEMSRRWANLAASSVDRDISEGGLAVCSDRSFFGSLYCFPTLFSLLCFRFSVRRIKNTLLLPA
ncbi:MAG: hypothetical protein VXZ15_00170, partial [Planctomycetota bacterium]|nr:hypothetical protein [Planctomycetota bacterium]